MWHPVYVGKTSEQYHSFPLQMESKLNAVRHYILDESYAGVPYKKLPKSVVEAFKGSSYKYAVHN